MNLQAWSQVLTSAALQLARAVHSTSCEGCPGYDSCANFSSIALESAHEPSRAPYDVGMTPARWVRAHSCIVRHEAGMPRTKHLQTRRSEINTKVHNVTAIYS